MILAKFGKNPTLCFQEEDETVKRLGTFGSGELKYSGTASTGYNGSDSPRVAVRLVL